MKRSKPGEKWTELDTGYLISNYGRVYSEKYKKILKSNYNSSGYKRVSLYRRNKRKHVFIHIKVVEKFGDKNGCRIPPFIDTLIEAGLSIDHIDGDKNNNTINNLELVTHQENCLRRSRGYGYELSESAKIFLDLI